MHGFPSCSFLQTPSFLMTLIPLVLAQAPVSDIVSWPPGLLLLASIVYASLGNSANQLWEVEPSVGPFLFFGLPRFSIPTMQRVNWLANACHFVPKIRTASGKSSFWVRSDTISSQSRNEALEKVLHVLRSALPSPLSIGVDRSLWTVTPMGLIRSSYLIPVPSQISSANPTSRDFLLFAAIDYHVMRDMVVHIKIKNRIMFSTKQMPPSAIIDVETEEHALYVVAAQLVRRPQSHSPLTRLAHQENNGELILSLDHVNRVIPALRTDFHSYAPMNWKVSGSLNELATAYHRVVQYLKRTQEPLNDAYIKVDVGQTLWIALLGGVLLDHGRMTIQNLPGHWTIRGNSSDTAYLTRLEAILQAVTPYSNTPAFFDLVFSGGLDRNSAIPFLLAGFVGQAIVCYFLSVGTSAGVWTSVALCNVLFSGRLSDIHSRHHHRTEEANKEPGMKMYVPGSTKVMIIATFDRSPPKQGELKPGLVLNLAGLVAAICGAAFQDVTRRSLGFGPFIPTPNWVIYTSIILCLGTSILIFLMLVMIYWGRGIWHNNSERPTRWMVYSTILSSFLISGLAFWFTLAKKTQIWPILDALTWISGIPLGVLENGWMPAVDDRTMHLILLNRWVMGAVASSVGSGGNI